MRPPLFHIVVPIAAVLAPGGSALVQLPLITRGPYLQSVTTTNIVVRWPFDNSAEDVLNGAQGSLVGAPVFMEGISKLALRFDGADDQAEVRV